MGRLGFSIATAALRLAAPHKNPGFFAQRRKDCYNVYEALFSGRRTISWNSRPIRTSGNPDRPAWAKLMQNTVTWLVKR